MAEELLRVENIHKNFGVTVALKDVSFSVERGYVYGLIGENGSGKSTVSSIIAGMQPATSAETNVLNISSSLGLASSAAVVANMFAMILGGYIGKWSNQSVGIIVAAFTIRIFAYGLSQMEFSEANSSVFSQLLFVGFLIYLVNESVFKSRRAEKDRVAQAVAYKKETGIA